MTFIGFTKEELLEVDALLDAVLYEDVKALYSYPIAMTARDKVKNALSNSFEHDKNSLELIDGKIRNTRKTIITDDC